LSAGGEEEAEAAYDEALHAIFVLQLERHRHTQPYISKKDGRSKWAMIEMSPMLVSLQRCKTKLPGLLPIMFLSVYVTTEVHSQQPSCCGAP